MKRTWGVLGMLLLASEARADDAPPPPERRPIPAFMSAKKPQSLGDLADKREGRYFTGLPLVNSDPDTGFGFGARVYVFDNGPKDDQMFDYTPYRQRAYGQAFFTTGGYQYHTIDYDAPYLFRQPYRLHATLAFEKNTAANYYGNGPASLDRLRFPGQSRSYANYSDYTDALRADNGSVAFTRENQYIYQRPEAAATIERDLFGGVVRILGGLDFSYVSIHQWTGRTVETDGDDRIQAPTRLDRDCAAGKNVGCGGGWDNSLKLGVSFDTRDFEPDPNSGFFVELTGAFSGKPLGSSDDWARVTFAPHAYWSPFPKLTDLVVAARGLISMQTEGVPFYAMNRLSLTDYDRVGLGGLRTIRGFHQDRFVGRAAVLGNVELRWTFYDFDLRRQHFALMAVPFFDIGRPFDTISDFELKRFRNGQGAGLRIAWNQATIIAIDYGVSREDSTLYINFNHPY